MAFSLPKALFQGFGNGINCSIFNWYTNKIGVVQNLAKTTAPFCKTAFALGMINGSIRYVSTGLKKKVKRDFNFERNSLASKGVDALELASAILTRYAVARLCNELFGSKVQTNYIHMYTAFDLIRYTSSNSTPSLTSVGLQAAITAKIFSPFIATPLFKNTFYFAAISLATLDAVEPRGLPFHNRVVKKFFGVKDPRALFVSHFARGLISLVSVYYVAKLCNKYLKLGIPRNYTIFFMASLLPVLGIVAYTRHIQSDIFGANFSQVWNNLLNSDNAQIKGYAQQINDIYENGSGDELSLERLLTNANGVGEQALETLFSILKALRVNFQDMSRQAGSRWLAGDSIETIMAEALTVMMSNQETANSVMNNLNVLFNVDTNKSGTRFILNHVLKDASDQTKEAFKEADPFRSTTHFIATKAVAIYAIGDRKSGGVPSFFEIETNTAIISQRDKNISSEDGQAILSALDAAVKSDSEDDFFGLAKASLNDNQKGILNELRTIASGEQQGRFAKTCWSNAAQKLS